MCVSWDCCFNDDVNAANIKSGQLDVWYPGLPECIAFASQSFHAGDQEDAL